MPFGPEFLDVLLLRQYNTRLVIMCASLLGVASGLVGSFLLLRKRSLMGDVLSHAALPGIGLAFMVMVAFGGTGKYLPGLLLGATLAGVIGMLLVIAIRKTTRLKDDTAMGIVLSVFFGLGVAILGMVQTMPEGSAAGLERFIYGKTASMIRQDFVLISVVSVIVCLICIALYKEFKLLCFDDGFTASQGRPVLLLDIVMLGLVTAVTVVGMQAVGLILIIAFLITPPAAARFWTHQLKYMIYLSALIGGISGWLGAAISALLPRLPAGSVIVLVAASVFVFSMIFGTARGVLPRAIDHHRLRRKVGRQHLLRSSYEIMETLQVDEPEVRNIPIDQAELFNHRTWSRFQFRRLLFRAKREDHLEPAAVGMIRLSESGFGEAVRITRNHRLWEMYLIMYADIAPSHVDRDADMVEHVLGADVVQLLEVAISKKAAVTAIPPSPHELTAEASS